MFFGRRFARSFVRKNDREVRELWKSQIWAAFVKNGLKFGGFSRFVRVLRGGDGFLSRALGLCGGRLLVLLLSWSSPNPIKITTYQSRSSSITKLFGLTSECCDFYRAAAESDK